jgi:hypothetical protein
MVLDIPLTRNMIEEGRKMSVSFLDSQRDGMQNHQTDFEYEKTMIAHIALVHAFAGYLHTTTFTDASPAEFVRSELPPTQNRHYRDASTGVLDCLGGTRVPRLTNDSAKHTFEIHVTNDEHAPIECNRWEIENRGNYIIKCSVHVEHSERSETSNGDSLAVSGTDTVGTCSVYGCVKIEHLLQQALMKRSKTGAWVFSYCSSLDLEDLCLVLC